METYIKDYKKAHQMENGEASNFLETFNYPSFPLASIPFQAFCINQGRPFKTNPWGI